MYYIYIYVYIKEKNFFFNYLENEHILDLNRFLSKNQHFK